MKVDVKEYKLNPGKDIYLIKWHTKPRGYFSPPVKDKLFIEWSVCESQ